MGKNKLWKEDKNKDCRISLARNQKAKRKNTWDKQNKTTKQK